MKSLLRKFQEEIARLKEHLEGKGKGRGKSGRRRRRDGATNDDDDEQGNEGDDDELYLKEQQDKLNEEKRTIMHKKNLNGNKNDEIFFDFLRRLFD